MTTQASINKAICIASWGNHGLVKAAGSEAVEVQYQRRIGRPLVGDLVDIEQQTDHQWLVTCIHPRSTYFARGDRNGRQQRIAANLDQSVIVMAAEPAPSRDLIDRYVIAAEILGITPLLVLNKIDLPEPAVQVQRERLAPYIDLGYQVLECSAESGQGIKQLADHLADRQSMLVGQSGVGKSSLLNRLIPDLSLQTSNLSTATGKGKHTTTIAQLYYLPESTDDSYARVIDSPGVWEYGLWVMPADELVYGFCEFREHLGKCHFNDCQHQQEPGCALLLRADNDDIFKQRLLCYQRLLSEQQRHTKPHY